tara:strand:- start:656 stop:907 length:252 start_codon:yes stop_codon:yes gene_type:complete
MKGLWLSKGDFIVVLVVEGKRKAFYTVDEGDLVDFSTAWDKVCSENNLVREETKLVMARTYLSCVDGFGTNVKESNGKKNQVL